MIGFRIPTHVAIDSGCRRRLPEVVRALRAERVLFVSDPGLSATPWPDECRRGLAQLGIECVTFDDVPANPRTVTAEAARDLALEARVDVVVALGGGSALDAGKAAAMLATNAGDARDFAGRERYSRAPLPFVAVPTTCGTGSEVTWVSVLSDERTRAKISLKGESMFPTQALVDADLIATLPANLVAWTGLDAFTHALEATTCSVANSVSDALAEKALALLFAFLPRAVDDTAGDREAREAVMRASTLAGLAFGNADVAAVHCLSETLGGRYDVHHGLANAMLLAPVFRSHGSAVEARLAELATVADPEVDLRAPVAERADRFQERLEELVRRLDVPAFASLGIPEDDFAAIAEAAVENGSNASNPRVMSRPEYLAILRALG